MFLALQQISASFRSFCCCCCSFWSALAILQLVPLDFGCATQLSSYYVQYSYRVIQMDQRCYRDSFWLLKSVACLSFLVFFVLFFYQVFWSFDVTTAFLLLRVSISSGFTVCVCESGQKHSKLLPYAFIVCEVFDVVMRCFE